MAWVGLGGGLFAAWLGYESLAVTSDQLQPGQGAARSFSKGVLLNLLNPHVYVFWASIGAPMVLKGLETGMGAAAFVVPFYTCLVGSKAVVALLVSRSRGLLSSRGYVLTIRCLGALLMGLAAWFIGQAVWTLSALLR
jgi:threonine/homoserine/homoserine lactone efflux protein